MENNDQCINCPICGGRVSNGVGHACSKLLDNSPFPEKFKLPCLEELKNLSRYYSALAHYIQALVVKMDILEEKIDAIAKKCS